MTGPNVQMYHVLALAETLLGLVANIFITVIILMDVMAGRKLKPFDKMFLSLGLSRAFTMCLFLFNIFIRIFRLAVYQIYALSWILNMIYLFLDFSSLWFSMWLCVLYYVKIVIFKNTFLIRVKLHIAQLVRYMILSSVFAAFLSGTVFCYYYSKSLDLMTPEFMTPTNISIEKEVIYMLLSYTVGHFIPFIMVSISTLVLVQSILLHITHLKSNVTSYTTPNMDAHLSAIRSILLVELLTVCYLIVTILFHFDFYERFDRNVIVLFLIAFPTFHSMVLIMGNKKLKKKVLNIFNILKRCDALRTFCNKLQNPK